jgi:hypothetical protein
MRSTEPGCFKLCSWSLWKALEEEGHIGLVLNPKPIWTCCVEVLEYGMIPSLKIKIKSYLKISEELECAFGIVGKILMSRI